MSRSEGFTPCGYVLFNGHVGISKTNKTNFVSLFCEYGKLLRFTRSSLRFVVSWESLTTMSYAHAALAVCPNCVGAAPSLPMVAFCFCWIANWRCFIYPWIRSPNAWSCWAFLLFGITGICGWLVWRNNFQFHICIFHFVFLLALKKSSFQEMLESFK